MNSEVVHRVLLRVFNSPAPTEQQQAMKELQQFENAPGYCSALLSILHAYSTTVSLNINEAVLCVICMKNLVNRHWMQPLGRGTGGDTPLLSIEVKAAVKNWLCQWMACPGDSPLHDKRIAPHVFLIIRRVSRYDWPGRWAELLPLLGSQLAAANASGNTDHDAVSNPKRCRCLAVLNHILRELSSKRLSSAKKAFCDVSVQLFAGVFAALKAELGGALQQLFALCQHHSQSPRTDRSEELSVAARSCFGALESCCLLADSVHLLCCHGLSAEWLAAHTASLHEYLGLIMHIFFPTAPANQQLLPMLRYLSQMRPGEVAAGTDLGVGAESCVFLFPVYDEETGEALADELPRLRDAAVAPGSSSGAGAGARQLGAVFLAAGALSSQMLGTFPRLARQHARQPVVQELTVSFGRLCHGLLQAEMAAWVAGAETLPDLPVCNTGPLQALPRNVAHICVLYISHLLSCSDFHAPGSELGAAILSACCTEAAAGQYTEWCCCVLLSKTYAESRPEVGEGEGAAPTDLELWRTEPEELFRAQEALSERDALRVAAEGLFLAVLEAQPEAVARYCVLANPVLKLSQPSELSLLLSRYALGSAQLASPAAVNLHNNLVLYVDNLLLCLGLGMFHFAHMETQHFCAFGTLLYNNVLLPLLTALVESPDTAAFEVVGSGQLETRLPLLQTRLCWLVTCSLYTVSDDLAVLGRVLDLCGNLLAGRVGGAGAGASVRVDVVLALQACDTVSYMLLNAGGAPGGAVYQLLLAPVCSTSGNPQRPGQSRLARTVEALSRLLLHKELLSGEQDSYFETDSKVIALLTELVAHYDLPALSLLGMAGIYHDLLGAFVQLWDTHVVHTLGTGAGVGFSPAYPTAIVEAVSKLVLAINANINEQLRAANSAANFSPSTGAAEIVGSAAVVGVVSLYPRVVQMIHAAVSGQLGRAMLGSEAEDADGCGGGGEEGQDTCRLEGLLLWGTLLRSCPPTLAQLPVQQPAPPASSTPVPNPSSTTLDALLLRLFASCFAPLVTSELLQSGDTDPLKALMLVLEATLLRYAPVCVQEMVLCASGAPAGADLTSSPQAEMATMFNRVLAAVAGRTIGCCGPRAVRIIMRPWVAVLGVAHPWHSVQLLGAFRDTFGDVNVGSVAGPGPLAGSPLVSVVRILAASSLPLCLQELGQTSVGRYAGGAVLDQLTHSLVEYRENNSSAASYVSVLCTLLAFSADTLEPAVTQLLLSLAGENRQLGELLSGGGGEQQQLAAAVAELVPWVCVSLLRFTMDMFETLSDNSKSCYYERRLWALALLSALEQGQISRRGAEVQRVLLFDLFPLVLLMVDGSGLLEQEVGTRGQPQGQMQGQISGQNTDVPPYHHSLFAPASRPLLSLCHMTLTTGFSVEEITDDDDDIAARAYGCGGCNGDGDDSWSDVEAVGMDGCGADKSQGVGLGRNDGTAGSEPARAAAYPAIVHMYADTLLQSDVMKTGLVGLMRARLMGCIQLCDRAHPGQPGLLQQAVVKVTGSADILAKYS